jgi:hypothetical protein
MTKKTLAFLMMALLLGTSVAMAADKAKDIKVMKMNKPSKVTPNAALANPFKAPDKNKKK